jgi:DNA polymerase-3 subunit beta
MEVHVDRDAFLRGLQMVHNIVEPRQTMPILANVLVEAEGDLLRLYREVQKLAKRVSQLEQAMLEKQSEPPSLTVVATRSD